MNKSISNKGSTLHPISSSNAKNDLVMMGNGQKPKKSTIQRSKSNEGLDHEMQKIDEQSEPNSVGDRNDMPTANAVSNTHGPAKNLIESMGSINDESTKKQALNE